MNLQKPIRTIELRKSAARACSEAETDTESSSFAEMLAMNQAEALAKQGHSGHPFGPPETCVRPPTPDLSLKVICTLGSVVGPVDKCLDLP